MTRPLRPKGAPLRPYWFETYRGGCSLQITNSEALSEAVDGWQLIMGLVQRLPCETRGRAIEDRRLILDLGGTPAHKIEFKVVRWHKESVTLYLHFVAIEVAVSQYAFWSIGYSGPAP